MPLHMKLPENSETPGCLETILFYDFVFHTNTLNHTPLPSLQSYFPKSKQTYVTKKTMR